MGVELTKRQEKFLLALFEAQQNTRHPIARFVEIGSSLGYSHDESCEMALILSDSKLNLIQLRFDAECCLTDKGTTRAMELRQASEIPAHAPVITDAKDSGPRSTNR